MEAVEMDEMNETLPNETPKNRLSFTTFFITMVAISWVGITVFSSRQTVFRSNIITTDSDEFTLTSSAFDDYGFLPEEYTCLGSDDRAYPHLDGLPQNNPPLAWENPPEGTIEYFLKFESVVETIDTKFTNCDWCMYNISKDIESLDTYIGAGDDGVLFGGTWDQLNNNDTSWTDPHYYYNAPCSSGPGQKNYTLTLYALNGHFVDYLAAYFGLDQLTDVEIYDNYSTKVRQLEAILTANNLILSNATLHVYYTRYKVILYGDDEE